MSWDYRLTIQKYGKLFPFWGSHNTKEDNNEMDNIVDPYYKL